MIGAAKYRLAVWPFWAIFVLASIAHAQTPPDQRGISVYSEHLPADQSELLQSLTISGVDGLSLLQDWNTFEPGLGVYNWTTIDLLMNAAISAGRKLTLAIRAGQGTPCWLFQAPACGAKYSNPYAGAAALTFQVSARQGIGQAGCNATTIAAPWDPVFLNQWDAMLASLAAHLKSAGTYGAVDSVRLTGVNRTTAELRLPEEILTAPCATNAIQTWLAASPPYRPSLVLSAWDKITSSFQKYFPDKSFGVEVVPVDTGNASYPFPEIDDNGCIYSAVVAPASVPNSCVNTGPLPDQNAALVQLAAKKFAGHLAVSFQNLDLSQPANPYPIQDAQTLGTTIGYQTNDYNNLEQAASSGGSLNPGPCTPATYLALLEAGIFPLGQNNPLRAQYIEVLPPDAISFPTAIQQAHALLAAPPVLTSGTAANGATYLPGGLVPGSWAQVKGTGLSNVSRTWTAADFANLGNNLPTSLGGTSVTVNGLPAALYYVDPGQVSFQVPTGVSGTASVQVTTNGATSNTVTGAAAIHAPGIFPIIVNGVNYAAAVFLDGYYAGDPSLGSAFRAAKPGDVVQLYATGLSPEPAGVLVNTQSVSGVTVTIGSVTFPADSATLVTVGEFQINFTVPSQFATLPPANYPVSVQVNGVSSPVTINSNPPGPIVLPVQH